MKHLAYAVQIGPNSIEIQRQESGVPIIRAEDSLAIQRGIGYVHAEDRLIQMLMTRIVADGRISEFLLDSDETFAFDQVMRKWGFRTKVEADVDNLTPQAQVWVKAYCEGVNAYIEKKGYPFICKLLKIKPTLWTVSDVMVVMKLHMYVGLAQAQERSERFIIQAIHDGVSIEKLKTLFSPFLDKLDPALLSLIKKVPLEIPYLDEEMIFMPGMSNNWALSGKKTASGFPLLCNDPHLQINRLPAIWYEVVTEEGMGVTTPGVPGMVIGRSPHLSVGVTYGMMDSIDFFIEEVKEGGVVREGGLVPLKERTEVISRKIEGDAVLQFYESDAGIIERKEASVQIKEGLYFALCWAAQQKGVAPTLNAMERLWSCKSVKEGQAVLQNVAFSFNWVLADSEGNIGYQQSGTLPQREHHSGLYPVPAWEKGALWNGFVSVDQLASEYNPERGFVLSANDDKHRAKGPSAITLPMASYRYERLFSLLSERKRFTIDEMKKIQCDLYSIQAKLFMDQIRSLIPDTQAGVILREWDLCYSADSQGATLFEAFYETMLLEVFGKIFGSKGWEEVVKCHGLLVFLHGHFDRILLKGEESWFGKEGKQECLRQILIKSLSAFNDTIPTWGEHHCFRMTHFLFEGKLTKYFGKGPFPLVGSRATVAASFLFSEHKRQIAAGASYRFIADLGESGVYSALCGGVTEGRFSPHYTSDLPLWLDFKYKYVKGDKG